MPWLRAVPASVAIWLPVGLTMVGAGPDENGTLTPLPVPAPSPVPVAPTPEPPMAMMPMKATLRQTVDTKFVANTKRDVQKVKRDLARGYISAEVAAQDYGLSEIDIAEVAEIVARGEDI